LTLFTDPQNSTIKVITNEINKGLPASLNIGILAARADYIVRVDSDDFVNANFLNFLLYYLETNSDADAVACDYLLLDDEERVLERCNCSQKPIACGILFRKSHLLEIGLYDENFQRHEERELRIRFEKKYTINQLELPLYRYRMHENNITKDRDQMEHHFQKLIAKHGTGADDATISIR
jgi:glycosyltransferase involved in cell wall biosynthesis